jgi:hypothetical protein
LREISSSHQKNNDVSINPKQSHNTPTNNFGLTGYKSLVIY